MPFVNNTATFFILKGISEAPRLQLPIFLLVLLIYLITLGGNITTILLVCLNVHLHAPMYFFLANLAMLDLSCSTAALHKIFSTFLSKSRSISHLSCLLQLFFFCSLTGDEFWILAAMSYDRYVAICKPLYYHMIMNWRCCNLLAFVSWMLGFLEITPVTVFLSRFICYVSNEIDHYVCDIFPLREITCSDATSLDIYIFIFGLCHLVTSFCLTFIPYVFIISCILSINSKNGRLKAFYTCSSHISVVLMLYVTIIFQYIASIFMKSNTSNKIFSLLNTAIVPMLNPIIYSLKNKEVKAGLQKMYMKLSKVFSK